MDDLFVSKPEVRVTFYPQSGLNLGQPLIVDTNGKADDLIAVQTQKDLGQPVGHFTVTLAPKVLINKHTWLEALRPGDLVVIEMGPDKPQPNTYYQTIVNAQGYSGLEPVMIGTIDDVRMTTQFNATDGRPERTISVTGRDLAKFLVDDQIWWDSWAEPQRAITGFDPEVDQWLKSGKQQGGKAAGLIEFLLNWLSQHFDITFGLAVKKEYKLLRDFLRTSLTTESPSIAAPYSLLAAQGAPWALMERAATPPLYVLHLDTRRSIDVNRLLDGTGSPFSDNGKQFFFNSKAGKWDAQPALMLYRNPWANRYYDDWLNLPLRVVEDRDLISMDLGRGNEEISNTWRVWAESQGVYRTQGGGDMADAETLKDLESIRRYGNRPLIITSNFISGFGHGEQKEIVKKFSFKIKDWNRWNEWYLNGRLTMKGMAAIKCGDRLWHWDTLFGHYDDRGFTGGVDFYVEGVTQDFRCFTGWTTAVTVTRGQKHRERSSTLDFTDVVFEEVELANPESAKRKQLQAQAEQVWVWGNTRK